MQFLLTKLLNADYQGFYDVNPRFDAAAGKIVVSNRFVTFDKCNILQKPRKVAIKRKGRKTNLVLQ